MAKGISESTGSVQEEATKLFGSELTKPVKDIDLGALSQVVSLEKEATTIAKSLKKEIPSLITSMSESFSLGLESSSKVPEQEKDNIQSIFSDTILRNLEAIPNALYENLKEGKGILFNGMMNEKVVDVLESILDFKKSIDEIYPGLSDTLMKVAAAGITAAVTAISPAAGVALKASGIMDIAQDFLKTENLENTIDKLKDGLVKFEQDKELQKAKQTAEKTVEASKATGIATRVFNNIGLSSSALTAIVEDISKPALKAFMGDVAKYTEAVIPVSREQVSEKVSAIKEQMIETMREKGVPDSAITQIEEAITTRFEKAEKLLAESLSQDKDFFDKVVTQQEAGKMILEVADKLAGELQDLVPNSRDVQNAVSKVVAQEVKKRITGPVEEIQKGMKDPEVSKIAKKEMGASIRSNIAIERTSNAVDKAAGVKVSTGKGRSA